MKRYAIIFPAIMLLLAAVGWSQEAAGIDTTASGAPSPAPPTNVRAFDTPKDDGRSVTLRWEKSVSDGTDPSFLGYKILRSESPEGPFVDKGLVPAGATTKYDRGVKATEEPGDSFNDREFYYKVVAVSSTGETESAIVAWAQASALIDSTAKAAPPGPPLDVKAADTPNDNGCSITVTWQLSPDDGRGQNNVKGYRLLRADSPAGPFVERCMVPSGITEKKEEGVKDKEDPVYFPRYHDFYYKVVAVSADGEVESPVVGPVQGIPQWFNKDKLGLAVGVAIFTALILVFIRLAKKGIQLYIRPLAGIDAVDEAIGRATEMGKPILYVLGLGVASDIATIASFTILSRVAKKVAEYQTSLIVPCYDPIVMTVAQETVRASYYDAGRPDAYSQDMVFFLTSYQFAYVGGVNGIMLRQLPATNFYLGKFFAESLLLAETGAVAGSIQIAGTDEVTQIPFFVVACDYTLIGEELYAASAYLGREPVLLGSLKAQDWGKALVIASIIIGFLAALFGWMKFAGLFDVGA